MTNYVAFDLDSTLCDTRHRWAEAPAQGNTKTWRDYAMACEGDPPVGGVTGLARLLQASHPLRIISWRHQDALWLTESWLARQGIRPLQIHLLGGDENISKRSSVGSDSHVDGKLTLIERLGVQGHRCVLFVDDHPPMAAALAAAGVPGLIVNPMYRDDPMAYALATATPVTGAG